MTLLYQEQFDLDPSRKKVGIAVFHYRVGEVMLCEKISFICFSFLIRTANLSRNLNPGVNKRSTI